MTFREKLYQSFDIFIPGGTSLTTASKEIGRRGKVTIGTLSKALFLMLEQVEDITERLDALEKKPSKK